MLAAMGRILALWATPRTVSTAFERMMIERGDHTVFDEPFSVPYYFGPERTSPRFPEELEEIHPMGPPIRRIRAPDVLARLRAVAEEGQVFFKDMAYHVMPYVDAAELSDLVHTFLIRDPRWALPSLARIWPDFTADEAGYRAQLELFEGIRAQVENPPIVIDSDDLRRSPERMVRGWCDAVGIPFVASALSWQPGMQPQWERWREWYGEVSRSTGFRAPVEGEPPAVKDRGLEVAIEEAMPLYRELAARALRPAGS
jgi:hypothetical protein